MPAPIYYSYNKDGVYTGARNPQIDPKETELAGEPVYMLPRSNETTVATPPRVPGTAFVWNGTSWDTVNDYRGEEWYTSWMDRVIIDEVGEPVDKWRTREDLPVEELRRFAKQIVFNWGYYKKYGDNEDVTDGSVSLWADSLSLQQLMLEYMYADAVGANYPYPYTWYGKNGSSKVINNLGDFRQLLLAYRNKQDSVHTLVQQKKTEAQNATTKQELYDLVNGMWQDLLATGEWED